MEFRYSKQAVKFLEKQEKATRQRFFSQLKTFPWTMSKSLPASPITGSALEVFAYFFLGMAKLLILLKLTIVARFTSKGGTEYERNQSPLNWRNYCNG